VDEVSDLSFPNILHNTYFPAEPLVSVLPSYRYPQSISNSDEIDKFDAAKSAGVVFLFLLTGFYTTTIMAHKA
jgi:hypothetical protein